MKTLLRWVDFNTDNDFHLTVETYLITFFPPVLKNPCSRKNTFRMDVVIQEPMSHVKQSATAR